MNILVIGNGFDLAHELPTKYGDFLEFSRILKSGGVLLLTAPFGSLTHFSPYHFSTGFNKYWYEKCLSDHDFQIEIMEANGGYFDYLRQEVLRIPSVAKTYLAGTSIFCKAACIILAAFFREND